MSVEFLAEQNIAGQTLLRLVSRGNLIIAELLRLSAFVPRAFQRIPEQFSELIFDFRYNSNDALLESRIQDKPDLVDLDANFKASHLDVLGRFYTLFEGIFKYVKDLRKYVSEVDEGVFIQLTIESILQDDDGKQLLCEAFYLYCVILTLMDTLIEGPVRERLIISYLRYKGTKFMPSFDEVCKLCGTTGYVKGASRRPPNYPESLFARFPLPPTAVNMIIGKLRSDDIYNQVSKAFPHPDHRSVALSRQASMIYMILYLAPNILMNEPAVMREIVDKHFPDNWVITYYLGYTADLSVEWDRYKAAKAAVAYTIAQSNVTNFAAKYWNQVTPLKTELQNYLREGILVEDYILDHINQLLNCARNSNVALRWLMLHFISQNKKVSQIVVGRNDITPILGLLLDVAQFEWVMNKILTILLDQKGKRWDDYRKESSDRMNELGEFFSGTKELTRVKPNKRLEKWFHDIANQINSLDYSDSVMSGRKIQQLIQALEEVEQFHHIESSLQVKQFLIDTRKYLQQMLRLVNISPKVKVTLALVSDISYGWEILRTQEYVSLLQQNIREQPSVVLKLRSVVVKLSSILDLTALRIDQAKSPDLMSVGSYYSGELMEYVRKVLEVIPVTVFNLLEEIIELQTKQMKELPTKVEKEKIQFYAQLEDRYQLAYKTHAVSVFAEGILAMEAETTFVGVIKIDPKKLLEDGIRKELVSRLSTALHTILDFRTGRIEDLFAQLQKLSKTLDGHCRSFQYIQDYIRLPGLKVWQEEFMRIVNFNVEQECNRFLAKGIDDNQSQYQSREIPITTFPPLDTNSVNFIGRLGRELLAHTHYRRTNYQEAAAAWIEISNGRELVTSHTFVVLLEGVSVFGLNGLDQLYCFMIVKILKDFFRNTFERPTTKDLVKYLLALQDELHPTTSTPERHVADPNALQVKSIFIPLLEVVCKCGQLQLLRHHLASTLRLACKSDSTLLSCSMDVLNSALLKDIHAHYKDPANNPYPDPSSPLLPELSKYLETAGHSDPFTKLYVTTKPQPIFAELFFLFILSQMRSFSYTTTSGLSWNKSGTWHDMKPFVIGVVTLLKQVHFEHTQRFIAYICQKIRSLVLAASLDPKITDFPQDAVSLAQFIYLFSKHANIPRATLEGLLPPVILDICKLPLA
ncbi:WASH complex subunit 5 [Pelomyxa schiedti]|nr:WASH complex subunit 5 [Pelomyxa schiedti]